MRKIWIWIVLASLAVCLNGCGSTNTTSPTSAPVVTEQTEQMTTENVTPSPIKWDEMEKTGELENAYATMFHVDYYDEYRLITVSKEMRFLIVPENALVPENLEESIVVLQQPLDSVYLVNSSAIDYFRQLNAIDRLSLSGTKQDGWYVDEAVEAMASGKLVYAGKYNTPDYELIVSTGCDLAIENTMIFHSPEVKEKLEELDIPVFVDYASYEGHPLGRMEWLRVYGILVDKEAEANEAYENMLSRLEPVMQSEKTDKTVAFFSITAAGKVTVRKGTDYIAKSIDLAGGNYLFADLSDDSAQATAALSMEAFYATAKDADVLIYNASYEGEIETLDQLLDKSSVLADFKAFETGNIWCTGKNLFQHSLGLEQLMLDIHAVVADENTTSTVFLSKIQ